MDSWHSQMHNTIWKLTVRCCYLSVFSWCLKVLDINHKLLMLQMFLCFHCDLLVNWLFFHLYLRTDKSMLGLASLSVQTKSLFQTHSVVPINCSPSEVMLSGLEVTTPPALFVSYSHKCATIKSVIESLFNWRFFLFTCRKTVPVQKAHCEVSRYVGIWSLVFFLCFHAWVFRPVSVWQFNY